ncbi:MAG TPA: DMT family transporter [Anaerolineae bacterium]|nr:DMT family transporter [Anaerolineae bacterium]
MGKMIFVVLVAIIGGITITLQGQLMGIMDRRVGTFDSVAITYGIGGITILSALLLRGGSQWQSWSEMPWFVFFSGILGLVIVSAISYSFARIGVVTTLVILVASQFVAGAVLEHFEWLEAPLQPMTLSRGLGFAVILLGVWLVVR